LFVQTSNDLAQGNQRRYNSPPILTHYKSLWDINSSIYLKDLKSNVQSVRTIGV
jgi:hypothetical protein